MPAAAAIQVVLQLLSIFPSVEPAVVNAVNDFKNLFDNGAQPTTADIDALIDRIKTQSAAIQAL